MTATLRDGSTREQCAGEPIVSMTDVRVEFRVSRTRRVTAVNGVSLELYPGEVVGLIGESGSGKSTLARAMLGLIPLAGGEIRWRGAPLSGMAREERRAVRTQMQMVFQDPHSALDPRQSILRSVREPLDVLGGMSKAQRALKATEMLEKVGLNETHGTRYPHELSGGQKQRACIARALITDPQVLVCDESVAALDVALQAEILNLLRTLKDELGLTILFISHDLSVVAHLCDRINVMYLGAIVEAAHTEDLVDAPRHPYSEALISAQPVPLPPSRQVQRRIVLHGDLPSPLAPPSGCTFHTRCGHAQPLCAQKAPQLESCGTGHLTSCHFTQELTLRGTVDTTKEAVL